jgi:histidinol-phosphatase
MSASPSDVARAVDTARAAVAAAASAALRHFHQGVHVETKPDRTPVTAADRDAEAAILAVLRANFPSSAVLSEESGALDGDPGSRWIVDPLDGTRGFTRGGAFWGPLVAWEHEGEILAGAMALPALGRTYWAGRGLGAFRDGARLRLSGVAAWPDATLSLGEVQQLLVTPGRDAILALATSCATTRAFGDLAAVAMLLDGQADAWLEAGVKPWDLGPMPVLVEEAGGRYTDVTGARTITHGTAVGTNGRLHEHALSAIRAPAPPGPSPAR